MVTIRSVVVRIALIIFALPTALLGVFVMWMQEEKWENIKYEFWRMLE